jgi:hypothetical protein
MEANEIALPQPKHINAVCRILGIEPREAIEALGFDVGDSTLTPDERELLAAFRRLRASPALQETALRVVRALLPPPSRQPRSLRAAETGSKYQA